MMFNVSKRSSAQPLFIVIEKHKYLRPNLITIGSTNMNTSIVHNVLVALTLFSLVACSPTQSSDNDTVDTTLNLNAANQAYTFSTSSTFETVALTDDPAPGTPDFTFSSFSNTVLNDTAELAFYGLVNVPGSMVQRDGIWYRDNPGNISLLAIRSGVAPGPAGLLFDDVFQRFILNNTSQLIFGSSLNSFLLTELSNNEGQTS